MSAFIEAYRARFGVEPICRVLGVPASAHYERRGGCRSPRAISDGRLLAAIEQVHEDSYGAYGSRRTWKELRRRGIACARCSVERLMRGAGIQASPSPSSTPSRPS